MPEPTNPTSSVAERSPQDTLSQMIHGYETSQAIFVAVRLGIADLLKEAPKSSEELAVSAGVNAQALYRLLRVLASAGVLHEVEPRHFALTPIGVLLQKGNALRASAIMRAELYWPAYGELLYAVQTGRSAFERAFGMSIYDYLATHPEADAAYAATMTTATSRIAMALAGRVPAGCGYCCGTSPHRLREINQPVLITRNWCSRPHPRPLTYI